MSRSIPLLLVLTLAACSHSDSYVIGAAAPWNAEYGVQNRRGVQLAVDEINRSGGINGHPLSLVERDDKGDGVDAARIATEFVADERISAVVGHVTSGGMIAAAHVYDGELPAIATSATSPDLTGISTWTFRVTSSDSLNAEAIATLASRLAGQSGVAVLYENNRYGRGLAASFKRAFSGRLLAMEPIDGDVSNAEPYISYLRSRQPSVVFVAGRVPSGLRILREARRQNFSPVFIGGDGWQGLVPDTSVSEGLYVGASFTPEDTTPAARHFVSAFEARFKTAPDPHAALAYDATRLLATAMRVRGPDRRAIRDYLHGLTAPTAFHGITGPIYFGDNGDPVVNRYRIFRVHDGALTRGSAQ